MVEKPATERARFWTVNCLRGGRVQGDVVGHQQERDSSRQERVRRDGQTNKRIKYQASTYNTN